MRKTLIRTAALATGLVALAPTAAFAASGNGVTGETIVPCTADGTCSTGAAGTYSVTRAGNILTITSVAVTAPWRCATQVVTGSQTRIECLNGSNKIVAQAEVKNGAVISKVRTKIV